MTLSLHKMNTTHEIPGCVHAVNVIVINPSILLIFLTAVIKQCANILSLPESYLGSWHIAPFWVDIGRNQLGLALTATSRLNPLHELSFCHVRILSIFNPHLPLTVPAQTLAFSRSNFCHSLTANAFCPCTGVGFGFKFPWIALLCSSRRVNAHCYSARPNHYSVDDFDSAYHFRAPSTVCIVDNSLHCSHRYRLVQLPPRSPTAILFRSCCRDQYI